MTVDEAALASATARAAREMESAVTALDELVRVRSISSDPAHLPEVRRSAQLLDSRLRTLGFESRVLELPGMLPTVIGVRGVCSDRPTALLYAHHDVQPAGNPAAWTTDAFEPHHRGTTIFGRGSADNKAGIVAHLAAIAALDDSTAPGIVVVLDGGEEIGSPGFAGLLRDAMFDIDPQLIIVNDGINWERGVPSVTTSLRGHLAVDVTITVMAEEAHNGINGGPVIDAVTGLSHLIASLHDDAGNVVVAGLTMADGVGRPSNAPNISAPVFRSHLGLAEGVNVVGENDLVSRLWYSAAISVIGFDAPAPSAATNVLLPSATARLSLRLPPGTSTAAAALAIQTHLLSRPPFGATVSLRMGTASEAWSDESSGADALEALTAAWGTQALAIGAGGGIPVVSALAEAYPHSPLVITAVCDPDSNPHGPNENVSVDELERAVIAEILLLESLSLR